jgi:uncharacterized protein YdaU (DUF1376 family)
MKEFPYIKFFVNQWLTGTISFLTLEQQGAYMKACCYFWSRECEMPEQHLRAIIPDHYDSLVKEGLIIVENKRISIKWLDEQIKETKARSIRNSANGRKGGLQSQANARQSLKHKDKSKIKQYKNPQENVPNIISERLSND